MHQPHRALTVPSAAQETSNGTSSKLCSAAVLLSFGKQQFFLRLPRYKAMLGALSGWLRAAMQVGLSPLTITPSGGKAAAVTFTDFVACDAIEHVLDTVLLPESVSCHPPILPASR